MTVVRTNEPSTIVSTGLSVTTVALAVAGAAAEAVPIVKQILNCAAQVSAVAEVGIQKKREAMYLLVEKADIYATQIDIAVAGRVLDDSLQRRLKRLYSVFLKIEHLVVDKAGGKGNSLRRLWRNVITKPIQAEELVVLLDREVQLFQLLTGIQLNIAVDDAARAAAADAKYKGQFRILRDCDVQKLDVIRKRKTESGMIVWSSARVDGQLMVVRHVEPLMINESKELAVRRSRTQYVPYDEFLTNVEKVSTIGGSHRSVVQLYGRHVQGPDTVFRSGTVDMLVYLNHLRAGEGNAEAGVLGQLKLAYKILEASLHLERVHGLAWIGTAATVDDFGEPHIGLFDDIVQCGNAVPRRLVIYLDILSWIDHRYSIETGIVGEVHGSSLHLVILKELHNAHETDRLQAVWQAIYRERLVVGYNWHAFPLRSETPSHWHKMLEAQQFFRGSLKNGHSRPLFYFMRCALTGGADSTPPIRIYLRHSQDGEYSIWVETCTHDDGRIRYDEFFIDLPNGSPLVAQVARAVGLSDDFEASWPRGSRVAIYQRMGKDNEEDEQSGYAQIEEENFDEDCATAEAEETDRAKGRMLQRVGGQEMKRVLPEA